MKAPGVVEADFVSERSGSVLLGSGAMTMSALVSHCREDAFDSAALLQAVRSEELQAKTVGAHHAHMVSIAGNEPNVRRHLER
jgi:hypothetical protein